MPVAGNYTFVSTDLALELAKMMLQLENTSEFDDDIEKWINVRLMGLGGVDQFKIQQACLDVVDGIAEMPNGINRILALRYCTDDGVAYGHHYVDMDFLNVCGCEVQGGYAYGGLFTIMGNNIKFLNPASSPEKVKIMYKGYVTDGDGLIMIKDYMAWGLACFAAYNIALTHKEKYTQVQLSEYKRNYISQGNMITSRQAVEKFMRSDIQNSRLFSKKTISII
jgi:hypothetical protein